MVRPTGTAENQKKYKQRYANEDKNPCVKEAALSLKCLEEHFYDHSKCDPYFRNVRNCRQFWKQVQADRKRDGVKPHLPPPEERDAIRKEYKARAQWDFSDDRYVCVLSVTVI